MNNRKCHQAIRNRAENIWSTLIEVMLLDFKFHLLHALSWGEKSSASLAVLLFCPFCFALGSHSAFLGFDLLALLTCSPASEIKWQEEWLVKLSGAKILEFFSWKREKPSPFPPPEQCVQHPGASPSSGEDGFNFCHEQLTHPSSLSL